MMSSRQEIERIQTVVIGGGQAGLSVGYHLARRGLPSVILDAYERVGDAWRRRWDSLRLFTPAYLDALPGLRFPAPAGAQPTKDQVADYLEVYARHFQLPVRTGLRVEHLTKDGRRFVVTARGAGGVERFEADQVVVAMSNYQVPRVPLFAGELDSGIAQLHSSDYRNPTQLRPGAVLVVGVGNSGAEIGIEVARKHSTWLSGKESGHIPFRIETAFARHVLSHLVRFVGHHVLTLSTPIGRRLRPVILRKAAPLVRVKPADLAAAGIERVPRVVGVRDGLPLLEDGRVLQVANVIWCTGFHPGFSWIHLPIFEADGAPRHDRGIVPEVPGLYFVGLHFLYAESSATLIGVSRDAARIAAAVATRVRDTQSTGAAGPAAVAA
jgi:putative flavoprotein involved in K+ transport